MINLHNKDCMIAMAEMEDNQFDLAIVDPPYGIGDTFIGFSSGKIKGKLERKHKKIKWDNEIPSDDYFSELKRISKKQIIWGANYFNSFDFGGALVWYKNRGGDTLSQCEIASISGQKKVDYLNLQVLTGFCSNENRIHPTQKPVALYKWLLDNYATCKTCHNTGYYDEDVAGDGGSRMEFACDCGRADKPFRILDTHGGSMSIAIACIEYGFDLDLYEIDKDYFNEGVKRVNQHASQSDLFKGIPKINIYE